MGLILLVTEDLDEIERVKATLSVHGWWITVAADRQAALQAAADQAPKLVLVDNDLPDATELMRSFGSVNGGPGVVALVGEGFENTLEVKEAGADELLTRPASPTGLLEAVQRCLATPRRGPERRRLPSNRLLTTEEIFGDVLREIEEAEAPSAAAAPASIGASEPARTDERSVSLAGLFDDPAVGETAPGAQEPAAPEPAGSGAPGPGGWLGEERRSVDRPWSSPDHEATAPAAGDDSPPPPGLAEEADETDAVAISVPAASSEPAASAPEPPPGEELEADPAPPAAATPPARRIPRSALALGSLAAALLVAAGALFLLNPGSEPPVAPAPPETRVEPADTGVPAVVRPSRAAPEEAPPSPEPPAPPSDEIEEFDIEAIVDEELERREEVLRKVFLEEEKRLLRELNNLGSGKSETEEPADGEADGLSGVGR